MTPAPICIVRTLRGTFLTGLRKCRRIKVTRGEIYREFAETSEIALRRFIASERIFCSRRMGPVIHVIVVSRQNG